MRFATLALCAITSSPVALEAQSWPEVVANFGGDMPFGLTEVHGTLYYEVLGAVWALTTGSNAVPLAPVNSLSWLGRQAMFVGMGAKVYFVGSSPQGGGLWDTCHRRISTT